MCSGAARVNKMQAAFKVAINMLRGNFLSNDRYHKRSAYTTVELSWPASVLGPDIIEQQTIELRQIKDNGDRWNKLDHNSLTVCSFFPPGVGDLVEFHYDLNWFFRL